jgi:hypothetical protein
MNSLNAFLFALVGSAMEIIPVLFPSLFPRNCADQASTRMLWTSFMGSTQIALGAGYMIRAHVLPTLAGIISSAPAGESLPIPAARAVAGN